MYFVNNQEELIDYSYSVSVSTNVLNKICSKYNKETYEDSFFKSINESTFEDFNREFMKNFNNLFDNYMSDICNGTILNPIEIGKLSSISLNFKNILNNINVNKK